MNAEPIFFDCESGIQSRGAFDKDVRRIAGGLRASGLCEGDTVAFLMRNDGALAQAMVAADLAGVYSVPLNWHDKSDEIAYVLADSQAKLLIAHADLLAGMDRALLDRIHVVAVPTPRAISQRYAAVQTAASRACSQAPANQHLWHEWLAAQTTLEQPSSRPRGAIIYTSGTTGKPKGVQREPYRDLEAYQRNLDTLHAAFGTRGGMRAAITGPLYHGGPGAYWRAAYAACRDEGFVLLRSQFDAEELLALIERHRISHLFMVPTMFVRLLRLPEAVRRRYDISSVRHIVHTAAPCPVDVKAAMNEWFTDTVHEFYGTTETGPITVATPADARAKPGTVGRLQDRVTLRILEVDGTPLPPGQPGEICCRNSTYPDFVYRNRPADRAALDRQGLIATGDVGYLDEDGYLFICDRVKDMVISGGVNIYPAEIEAVLMNIAGVRDCAVFGIPDDEFGEALAAHIEAEPDARLEPADLRAQLATRLAKFKVPSVIRIEPALPREDNGKIYKRRLSDPYWEGYRRRI